MKKYQVIAVDDEGLALRRLNKMIDKHPQLELVASATSAKEALTLVNSIDFDLILLDIQLKDSTAFEMLNQVSGKFEAKIIFTTAFDQYAINAFEVGAMDYLLKPFSEEKFNQSIGRWIKINDKSDLKDLLKRIKTKENGRICIKEGNKHHYFNSDDILFIKAETYYSKIVQKDDSSLLRVSLKTLEDDLPGQFVRINRSYIINKSHIKSLTNYKKELKLTISNSEEFIVSQAYKDSIEF